MYAEFSHLYPNKFLLTFFLVLCAFRVATEEAPWLVAAESFSPVNIPSAYSNFPQIIPKLILARIAGIKSRIILIDEKKTRELQVISEARIKLIRERVELALARDKILLSSDPQLVKQSKKKETTDKIADKEKEILAFDEKSKINIQELSSQENDIKPLTLWKSGKELFVRKADTSLSSSLNTEKISALITGTVEDLAGYMFVTVNLETGIAGLPAVSVSEAASYDDIDSLVTLLTVRLLPVITNRQPVQLKITVSPKEARVFIDGHLIDDNTVPFTVFSGEHLVNVSAPGYFSASKTATFEGAKTFALNVNLEMETLVSVSFDTRGIGASLFLHTDYFGETPQVIKIPSLPTIGEMVTKDAEKTEIPTYFIVKPDLASENNSITVRTNKISTKQRIEKQRSVLYWSLGALYISLPFSMLSYGISMNKYQAFQDEKLPQTKKVIDEVNMWGNTAMITRYISIGFGVNLFIQIARYFLAAEQATPQYAE